MPGARVAAGASLTVALRGWSPTVPNGAGKGVVSVPVALDGAVFRRVALDGRDAGLVQWGIQGDMAVLAGFAAAKFPTLLGDPFLQARQDFAEHFHTLECGHRPSQALNSADRIPAPLY